MVTFIQGSAAALQPRLRLKFKHVYMRGILLKMGIAIFWSGLDFKLIFKIVNG